MGQKPSSQLTREFVDVDTPGIFSSIESPNSFGYSEVRRGLSLTIIEEQKNKGFKLERCIYQSGREGTKLRWDCSPRKNCEGMPKNFCADYIDRLVEV